MIWALIVSFLETFGKYLLAGLALAGIAAVWRFVFRKRVRNPEADDSESSPAEKLAVPRESAVEAPGAAANASSTEGAGATRADSPEAQEPVREVSQRDEAAGSLRGASRRDEFRMWLVVVALASFLLGGGTVLIVGMAALATMTTKGGETPAMISGTRRRVHDSKWLDIPTLEVEDIALSFPLVASGAQRKSLTCGVVIRFAPPEGEEADVKELQKTFIPRVTSLRSEFRKIVIEQMNAKGYSKLFNQEVKNQLLKTFRQAFQEKLKEHALDKHARVHQVMWGDFFWEDSGRGQRLP